MFVWFPELTLPLNPEEGHESWEDIFVEGMGHPFYQMNGSSVGTIERLIAAGPNGDESKIAATTITTRLVSFGGPRGDITDVGKERERCQAGDQLNGCGGSMVLIKCHQNTKSALELAQVWT